MAGGEGQGQGSGYGGAELLWSIIWFIILIFIGWPLGAFFIWWYILLLPFSLCIPALKDIEDILYTAIELPGTCTEKMLAGEPLCK